jgi:hypothetical protein
MLWIIDDITVDVIALVETSTATRPHQKHLLLTQNRYSPNGSNRCMLWLELDK